MTSTDYSTIRVIQILPTEAHISKDPLTKKYVVPVGYLLDDDRVIPSTEQFTRLRDAKAFQTTLPAAPTNVLHVQLTSTEDIIFKQTTFHIGRRVKNFN